MGDYFSQLTNLQEELKVPIYCAGDVVDRWRCTPGLLNWTAEHMPMMFAIPGQHDLPYHSYSAMEESGFVTLVNCGRIVPLKEPRRDLAAKFGVYPFAWNAPLKSPPKKRKGEKIRIALVHHYCYNSDATSHPGATTSAHVDVLRKKLEGFDVAVFGDNHIPFIDTGGYPIIVNHGTAIHRTAAERDLPVGPVVLYDNLEVKRARFRFAGAEWREIEKIEDVDYSAIEKRIARSMRKGIRHTITFEDAVERALDNTGASDAVRALVMEALDIED